MSDLAQWWQEQEAIENAIRYKLPEETRDLLREMERERNLSRSAWWKSNTCTICRRSCASAKSLKAHMEREHNG